MSKVSEGSDLSVARKMCFRHSCWTKYIGSLNKKLTEEQKSFIQATPFAWMVELKDSVKISRNLLSALISRWVERLGGFDMGTKVVGFSLLDVCLGLGLRVVGQNIDLNGKGLDSECKKLFGPEKVVDIEMLFDYILKHIKELALENFCKLYVLLAIFEFLLPNRNGRVYSILFNIVNDLPSIGQYNWGGLVYEVLVLSITEGKIVLRDRPSTKHFHLSGCVYLLQLWSFDHFVVIKSNEWCPTLKFPRILNRMDVKVGDHLIKRSLKDNMVVLDIAASAEELTNSYVQEGFQKYGHRWKGGRTSYLKEAVQNQEQVLLDLQKELLELKTLMKEKKKACHNPIVEDDVGEWGEGNVGQRSELNCGQDAEDNLGKTYEENFCQTGEYKFGQTGGDSCEGYVGGTNTDYAEFSWDESTHVVKAQIDEGEAAQESNMYVRCRDDPRKRFKSCAIRTPFATYSRRKHHK